MEPTENGDPEEEEVETLAPDNTYSWGTAIIYIFNLSVGIGALTLPGAMQDAGIITAALFLLLVCCLALVTASWMVEAQSLANAVLDSDESTEGTTMEALLDGEEVDALDFDGIGEEAEDVIGGEKPTFHLQTKVEMGHMAQLFLGRAGQAIFYLFLIVYLLGDLAIYAVYVPDSIAAVLKTHLDTSTAIGAFLTEYRTWVGVFSLVTVPFCFFDFQKTKYLQMFTLVLRYVAFSTMIGLALKRIFAGEGMAFTEIPWFKTLSFQDIAQLFGKGVYSFMCHHSIPGFITPIDRKRRMTALFVVDFTMIWSTYMLFCSTAIAAYGSEDIPPAYTNNFENESTHTPGWIADGLAMFPVFTITTNFPLIAITLRNNMIKSFQFLEDYQSTRWIRTVRIPFYTLISVVPPLLLALVYKDVGTLVEITGSYPGLGIMYLMPMILVVYGRKICRKRFGHIRNPHRSPFKGKFWIIVIALWTTICLGFTIYSQGSEIYDHFASKPSPSTGDAGAFWIGPALKEYNFGMS